MFDRIGKENWETKPLFSLAKWKNGLAYKNIRFSKTGRPIIKIAELKSGVTGQTKFTNDIFEDDVRVAKGDMLFSWSGNPETSIDVFIWDNIEGWLNQHIFKVTPSSHVDRDYFFFLLKWLKPRFSEIAKNKQTTGLGHVTVKDLKEMKIALPNLQEQRYIVASIKPIHDKIEANRRMNETLEAMAQALFHDWFVDFGPTKAKMRGEKPYLAPDIWNLFPDRLGTNALPLGWECDCLSNLANYRNGLALQKYAPQKTAPSLPVIKIAEMRSGVSQNSGRAAVSIPEEYIVNFGDVLFSWSGSLLVKFWAGETGALNQHLFKIEAYEYSKWLCYLWTKHHLPEFQVIASSKATTMGHIKREHLDSAKVVLPPKAILEKFDRVLGNFFEMQVNNCRKVKSLAEMRDTLLPRLMSGALSVKTGRARK